MCGSAFIKQNIGSAWVLQRGWGYVCVIGNPQPNGQDGLHRLSHKDLDKVGVQ